MILRIICGMFTQIYFWIIFLIYFGIKVLFGTSKPVNFLEYIFVGIISFFHVLIVFCVIGFIISIVSAPLRNTA